MKEVPEVIIDDFNCAWLDCPIYLKDFSQEVRKNFKKGFWMFWLDKWIIVRESKGHGFKIRLVQKENEELYPEIEKNRKPLINFHAGILFSALIKFSQTQKRNRRR